MSSTSKPSDPRNEYIVAIHEAGHVVVGHLLGLALSKKGAAINHDEGYTMFVNNGMLFPLSKIESGTEEEKQSIEREMLKDLFVSIAGNLAEEIHTKKTVDVLAGQDGQQITEVVQKVLGCSRSFATSFVQMHKADAKKLMKKHWAVVVKIADAIMEKKTVTGKELETILAESKCERFDA